MQFRGGSVGDGAAGDGATTDGIDEADNMLAVKGGGVLLHKIRGVMHDTCATANLTATLMNEKRNTSGQLKFGYDEWENLAAEDKPWFDFLCGNHVRNLPIDEFN
jgi:hypothetical protein